MSTPLSPIQWIELAYKKLKGALYFDKTQSPLVWQIVKFEEENIEEAFSELEQALTTKLSDEWKEYSEKILKKIDTYVYPKKLQNLCDSQVIFNTDNEPIQLEKAQYFIKMPVIGHILGVLWILTVGLHLDNRNTTESSRMYEHSYGNRLRKNLYNAEGNYIADTPYLFEPYFSQYTCWRDTALDCARQRLDNKQDALILTLDLRSFFYSVHVSKAAFDALYEEI